MQNQNNDIRFYLNIETKGFGVKNKTENVGD